MQAAHMAPTPILRGKRTETLRDVPIALEISDTIRHAFPAG